MLNEDKLVQIVTEKVKTYIYHLTDENSQCLEVCKWFFLTT